jgi:hypothetical protein
MGSSIEYPEQMRDHAIHNRWKRKLATAIVATPSDGHSKITAKGGGKYRGG